MLNLRKLPARRLAAVVRRPSTTIRLSAEPLEPREAPAADLSVEILAAPNFVVDSNLKSGPTAAYVGARITNTGTTRLTNAVFHAGDYVNGTADTPGLYPTKVSPPGYTGSLALVQEGGRADAVRYLGTLAPGQSVVQYWLVSYPWRDAAGKSTFGAQANNADDLALDYDVWVTADRPLGGTATTVTTGTATLRSEISALANKIWPNTTSKVPNEYLDAFQEQLGWRPDPTDPEANTRLEGVWYDMGRVNQGFDADRNGTPDYDVWMQPVGDPDAYDAGSWRLTKAYGVLIVKLNDGTEQVIAFDDRLYHKDLPANNTGVVGLVFYQFVQIGDGAGTLSPYQEAASGSNNEKFNGDYGVSVGSPTTVNPPQVTVDKVGPAAVSPGATAAYTITAANAGPGGYGKPELGLPAVLSDVIPAGTVYVGGSAGVVALPAGVTATVLYSTSNGQTWTTTEPANPALVTNLQWWLSGPLAAGQSATVGFSVAVPAGYAGAEVVNVGGLGMGNTVRYTDAGAPTSSGRSRSAGWCSATTGPAAASPATGRGPGPRGRSAGSTSSCTRTRTATACSTRASRSGRPPPPTRRPGRSRSPG